MKKHNLIAVLGGQGFLGQAVVRQLKKQDYTNITVPQRRTLNLLDKSQVDNYFKDTPPEYIFMVAGLVAGIAGNMKRPADFLYENSQMILNLLEAIKNYSPTTKILFTGSTCIYPKINPQPINEDRLLMGPLEETNKGYAIAKILGIVAGQLYRQQYGLNAIAVMPTNMYGPHDNYDLENGHFLPSLIKKFVDAKINNIPLVFWGTGQPRREALFVDDCARACIYLMNNYNDPQIVNIGTGFDYSIKEFIEILQTVLNYQGEITWDMTKPDGTFEKLTDITRLKNIMPEFSPRSFLEGVKETLAEDFKIKL